MFDIGIGEILAIGVIALLVFGPDRLPRAAADAGRWVRRLREMAAGARQDIANSAGVDLSDALDTVRSLQELHPRRIAATLMTDDATDTPSNGRTAPAAPGTPPPPVIDPDAT